MGQRPSPTDKKTQGIIRKLRRLEERGIGKRTTGWEKDFLKDVQAKLNTFGSAFVDEEKGNVDESLSYRQAYKMHEISRMIRHRLKKLGSGSGKSSKAKHNRPSKIVPR